jgi:uncharacterized protein YndB with AHSA1/START domain
MKINSNNLSMIKFKRFSSVILIFIVSIMLSSSSIAQTNKKDSITDKDFRLATEKKIMPKSAVDSAAGLVLVNGEVAGTPMQVFNALNTNETEKWWKLTYAYYLKDWKADIKTGGKWSVMVEINGGTQVHEWGEYCEVDTPYKFIKTKQMDANPFVGQRQTTVTFYLAPSPYGTLVTIREEGFIGLTQAAFGTAENWEKVLTWLDAYLIEKNKK